MSHVRLAAAVAAVAAVSGCSSVSSISSSEQLQALKFESEPPGAEIRTSQLETCTTPCTLKVPPQEQSVAIARDGYMPQTVQITTGPPPDHPFWQHPPPTLAPNPVHVVLQPMPKPVRHTKGHRLDSAPAPSGASNLSPPSPPAQGPAARFSAFPPPPSKQ